MSELIYPYLRSSKHRCDAHPVCFATSVEPLHIVVNQSRGPIGIEMLGNKLDPTKPNLLGDCADEFFRLDYAIDRKGRVHSKRV